MAIAAGAVFFYERLGGAWPRAGAIAYNTVHIALGPLAVLAAAAWFGSRAGELIALIWLAHVGFDRALAYGFKYPTAFGDTHLGRVGR